MFVSDFILNGEAQGDVGGLLQGVNFNPGFMRPFINERGQSCVSYDTGKLVTNGQGQKIPEYKTVSIANLMKRGFGSPIYNDTSLRKDQWKLVDQTVLRVARERLMAWQDLTQIGTFSGFDGMAKTILETERVSDSHLAHIDMEGLTEGANDSPRFDLIGLPLPIIHSDFKASFWRSDQWDKYTVKTAV